MRLYIVRHGEAQPRAATDAARPLTERGRQSVSTLWQALSSEGLTPVMLAVSPYVRAQQTADIIAGYYPGIGRQTCDCITPDDDPARVLAWLGISVFTFTILGTYLMLLGPESMEEIQANSQLVCGKSTGEVINQSIVYLVISLALGVLTDISKFLQKIGERKQ